MLFAPAGNYDAQLLVTEHLYEAGMQVKTACRGTNGRQDPINKGIQGMGKPKRE